MFGDAQETMEGQPLDHFKQETWGLFKKHLLKKTIRWEENKSHSLAIVFLRSTGPCYCDQLLDPAAVVQRP